MSFLWVLWFGWLFWWTFRTSKYIRLRAYQKAKEEYRQALFNKLQELSAREDMVSIGRTEAQGAVLDLIRRLHTDVH